MSWGEAWSMCRRGRTDREVDGRGKKGGGWWRELRIKGGERQKTEMFAGGRVDTGKDEGGKAERAQGHAGGRGEAVRGEKKRVRVAAVKKKEPINQA